MKDESNEKTPDRGWRLHAIALSTTLKQFALRRLFRHEAREMSARAAAGVPESGDPRELRVELIAEEDLREIEAMLRCTHERGMEDGLIKGRADADALAAQAKWDGYEEGLRQARIAIHSFAGYAPRRTARDRRIARDVYIAVKALALKEKA